MPKLQLFELFKGTGSVGKVASKMNIDVISLDAEQSFDADITVDILKFDIEDFYRNTKWIPDLIWASPPCNTYSALNYFNKATQGDRDHKTAEPLTARARLGTRILYKTIDIIQFYLKLNPYLLFVIENPRGMMRKDKKIKKLNRATTLYCLYNDKRNKPTDFFTNFDLVLKEGYKCPKKTTRTTDLPLLERYMIPPLLIKSILEQMITKYRIGC